jgi:glycosyltransferase involved in cell wall biosynthesis
MISVVTITFNNCHELRETLGTLENVSNIESIVINGGSSQDSFDLLKFYIGTVVNEKDEGISDAFNKGWKYSKGQAVAYLNSGDLLLDKEYYAWADRFLLENSDIDFVYSDIIFNDPIVGELKMKPRGKNRNDLGKGMPFPHPSMVVRLETIQKIGGFSKNFKIAMDFDFVVRLLVGGYRGVYYPHSTVKMDGCGISTQREYQGIQECKKSLMQHGEFVGAVRLDYEARVRNYRLRKGVHTIFGNTILKAFKKLKKKLK